MRAEHAESLAVGRGAADRVGGGAIGVVGIRGIGPEAGNGRCKSGSATNASLASRMAGGDRRERRLDFTPVLPQVQRSHRLDPGTLVGIEITAVREVIG